MSLFTDFPPLEKQSGEVETIRSIKSPEEILQEEFLKERAAVLGKAGEKIANTLLALQDIEKEILILLESYHCYVETGYVHSADILRIDKVRRKIRAEINGKIKQYNTMREEAKLRYYYLIVTREALGLRKHQWVEAYYKIPPRRECLEE